MSSFTKNEPVTHWDKYGVQHSYYIREVDGTVNMSLISDGNDCYEAVRTSCLYKGHITNPTASPEPTTKEKA